MARGSTLGLKEVTPSLPELLLMFHDESLEVPEFVSPEPTR